MTILLRGRRAERREERREQGHGDGAVHWLERRDWRRTDRDGPDLDIHGTVAQRSITTLGQHTILAGLALPEPPQFYDFTPITDQVEQP